MNFLLDTGAAVSVFPFQLEPFNSLTKTVTGVHGKPQNSNFTKPLHCKVGNWQGTLLIYPQVPGSPTVERPPLPPPDQSDLGKARNQ